MVAKSLRTKVRRYAEERLRQYLDGQFGLGPEITIRERYEQWIKTKTEPLYRKSLVRSYQQHFECYILSELGRNGLNTLTGATTLSNFRTSLLSKQISVKTCRN